MKQANEQTPRSARERSRVSLDDNFEAKSLHYPLNQLVAAICNMDSEDSDSEESPEG